MTSDRPEDGPISNRAQAEVERILGLAAERAERAQQRSELTARRLAVRPLRELGQRRDALRAVSRDLESSYVKAVETLAAATQRLVSEARKHRVELPEWPPSELGPVEIKLSETREVTLRFHRGDRDGHG